MAFNHAVGNSKIYLGGYDLTNYIQGFTANGTRATAEVSTLGDTWQQFVSGLSGGTASLNGIYDPATGADVEVMQAAFGGSNRAAMIFPNRDTLGNYGIGLWGFGTSCNIQGDTGSAVTISADLQANNGYGIGKSLHALSAVTADEDGASLDNATATSNGGESLLLVTGFTADDVTIVIQDSADNASWATIATHSTLTAGNTTERKTVTGAVRRYLRYSLTSTNLTTITFCLLFIRR